VFALHVGGPKASNINLVLQREPRASKTWLLAGSILPHEEHVGVAVRELLFEEIGLNLTVDDLTLLDSDHVRMLGSTGSITVFRHPLLFRT
jgi:8-oxo-dGTP pyrophosphatase MutT (NUDIX family)